MAFNNITYRNMIYQEGYNKARTDCINNGGIKYNQTVQGWDNYVSLSYTMVPGTYYIKAIGTHIAGDSCSAYVHFNGNYVNSYFDNNYTCTANTTVVISVNANSARYTISLLVSRYL